MTSLYLSRRTAAALPLLLLALSSAAQDAEPPGTVPAAEEEELAPIVLPRNQVPADDYDDEFAEVLDAPEAASTSSIGLPTPENDRDRLRRLFTLYRNALDDGMFSEADVLAKQIVELNIRIHGLDSPETAKAITNLAIAQHGADDFESAELNFNAAIEIIERTTDRLNEGLINPLKGLAAAQLSQGKVSEATDTYERAVHVSHVNFGPHNLDQIEILESLAETMLAAGEPEEAMDIQERIFGLQARNVGSSSLALVPALMSQARWMHRLQLFDKERYIWRRVISIIEDHHGRGALELIDPLTGLGHSYLYLPSDGLVYSSAPAPSTGEIYLKRAVRIAEDHEDSTWQIQLDAILKLADFYTLTDKPNRAARLYRQAWTLLDGDEEMLQARRKELQTLVVLQDPKPPLFYNLDGPLVVPRKPDGFETGTVTYEYSVSTRGRVTRVSLIDARPAELTQMQDLVSRELRRAIVRPRVVDGDMVPIDSVTYSHDFYYRERDLEEVLAAAGDDDG